jgi:predicted DCC family thiol-disulfide oxidoreductase YuxK
MPLMRGRNITAMNGVATPQQAGPGAERIFYDGGCGLCHHTVSFLVRRDRDGSRFRFAPLGGETFEREVPAEARKALPDSLVLQRADGRLLLRSDAALHAMRRLGGGWALLAATLRWVPRFLRDRAYDLVARWRTRIFAPPDGTCPILPPELRRRFEP